MLVSCEPPEVVDSDSSTSVAVVRAVVMEALGVARLVSGVSATPPSTQIARPGTGDMRSSGGMVVLGTLAVPAKEGMTEGHVRDHAQSASQTVVVGEPVEAVGVELPPIPSALPPHTPQHVFGHITLNVSVTSVAISPVGSLQHMEERVGPTIVS
jgi:hypothetical protein